MAPAFSSSRQAAVFCLLIIVLFALPAALPKIITPDRRDLYPSFTVKEGPFSWIEQNIFHKSEDVDIVFIGSSHMWTAINAPYVQKEFSEALGRMRGTLTLLSVSWI